MHILTLPDELLGDIAAFLSALDLVHAQQVCRRFRNVLQSHAALQYTIELHATAMVDNPACRLPPGEKLRLLREKEDAWRQLNLSNRTTLPLKHNPSGIYDLTGGVLLLGERIQREAHTGTDNVRTVPLHPLFDADSDDGKAKFWNKIDLHKQVIDVGLAIPEHDLIAIVTYTYTIPAQFWASVDIHLIKHSTGQPHPAAAKPIIHCENTHYLPGNCSIMLEIAGDTMCFLLNNYFPFVADPATLAVYNWKTGRLRARRKFMDPEMFNSFVLLEPDTIVLPMAPSHSLEICRFDPEPAPAPRTEGQSSDTSSDDDVPSIQPTCVLELPPMVPGAFVFRMTCRCEPNPCGSSQTTDHLYSRAPFTSDPDSALMILHLALRTPHNVNRVHTMLVHRFTLLHYFRLALAFLKSTTSPDADADPAIPGSFPATDPATDAAPTLPWSCARSQPYVDGAADEPAVLPWDAWGPAGCRWFEDEHTRMRWITTTCGQRLVRVHKDGTLRVYDFNARAMKRWMDARQLAGEPVGTRLGEMVIPEGQRDVHRSMETIEEEDEGDEGDEDGDEGDEDEEDEGDEDDEGEESDEGDEDEWMEGIEDEDTDTDMLTIEEADEEDLQPGVGANSAQQPHPNADLQLNSQPDGLPTSTKPEHELFDFFDLPHRRVTVDLGTAVIVASSWKSPLESSLPYVVTSVESKEGYESALVDEDIIVGLKMDSLGRQIQEVVLHRMGGST